MYKVILFFLVLLLPVTLFGWKMESGAGILPATTAGSTTWQTITLEQTYDNSPLIFVLVDEGSGYNGDSPVSLRIRNVSTTSFEIVQVEPQTIAVGKVEGEHALVGFHYLAIEEGDHTLSDGTHLLAGIIDTGSYQGKNALGTKGWDTVSFTSSFTSTPAILTTIQSLNNESSILPGASSSPWMTVTMKSATTSSMNIALERAETSTGNITSTETIGYLAIDADIQGYLYEADCTEIKYETILTSAEINGWDRDCYKFPFIHNYAFDPNVIGSHNSRNGGDGGWLRRCSLSTTDIGVTIEEDQAADLERDHSGVEVGSILIFEKDFIFDSSFNSGACIADPAVNYKMDECYWLNGAGGVTGDIKDSSQNVKNATSSNTASIAINTSNPSVCNYGHFSVEPDLVTTEDSTAGNTNGSFTVAFWMNADQDFEQWAVIVSKSKSYNWDDGWGFVNPTSAGTTMRFFINSYNGTHVNTTVTSADGWVHVVGTYDQNTLRLYINGSEVGTDTDTAAINNSSDAIRMGWDNNNDGEFIGALDEVKFWNNALSASKINALYQNELNGKNYNDTPRTCPTCQATIAAHTWEYVGIPADLRASSYTIADVFGDDIANTYGTDWRIYRRDYSDTNNSSEYTYLVNTTDVLEFNKGYLLGSSNAEIWDVNNLISVDYNATRSGCTADACVEIDVKVASLNDDVGDDLVGEGPYRYNLSGFIGKIPVDWADCRFVIDGRVYTPSEAEIEGSVSKTVWQYNPGTGANSNGYTTCDDVSPGGCKLEPYKALWIELHGPSKGKQVKLLIPRS